MRHSSTNTCNLRSVGDKPHIISAITATHSWDTPACINWPDLIYRQWHYTATNTVIPYTQTYKSCRQTVDMQEANDNKIYKRLKTAHVAQTWHAQLKSLQWNGCIRKFESKITAYTVRPDRSADSQHLLYNAQLRQMHIWSSGVV